MRILSSVFAAAALVVVLVNPVPAQTGGGVAPLKAKLTFPTFSLPDVNGKEVSLEDFKGKAILLSFWSCYTDTCLSTVRVIDELLKEYGSLGLVAPVICAEVPPALEQNRYADLLKKCGTGQAVLIDKDKAFTKKLGVAELPTTYLIDRNHGVQKIITGVRPLMTEEFRAFVKFLVSE